MTPSLYSFGYVCTRCGISPKTLRRYIREGLITPTYTEEGHTAFDEVAIERLEIIKRLRYDLGVNLAGIDIILRLTARIRELQALVDQVAIEAKDPSKPRDHGPFKREKKIVGRQVITIELQE